MGKSVKDAMTSQPTSIDPSQTVGDAARVMRDQDVGSLPVTEQGRLVGVITDRDITVRVVAFSRDPSMTTVEDVMTPDPVTVHFEAPVEKALAVMRSHQVRRLVVVDDEGLLVGLVSLDDVLEFLAREFRMISQLIDKESPHSLAEA